VKHPEDKTDEEIVADIEKKVVQMIGNYTHKEWECAQKILKHQGRVNSVCDEMGVTILLDQYPRQPAKRCSHRATLDQSPPKPQGKVNRARRLGRQKVPQKVLKPKMSWPSGKQMLQKLPCLRLQKTRPSY
jgi:hypothetical protein